MVNIIYGGGPGHMRCIIAACARQVEVGIAESIANGEWYPIVHAIFDPVDLSHVLPLFRAMSKALVLPQLHIWNYRSDEPEVVVVFKLPNPSLKVLSEVCKRPRLVLAEETRRNPCREILTTMEANVPRAAVEVFTEQYADMKQAIVAVSDLSSIDSDGADPLHMFRITSFERCAPELL